SPATSPIHARVDRVAAPHSPGLIGVQRGDSPMSRISPIASILVPAALAIAIVPSAFAQDSAADKRVSVVAGYSMVEPTRNPEIAGTRTEFDGEGTPTLGVTYHITDNWGIEAWAADSYGQRINAGAGK